MVAQLVEQRPKKSYDGGLNPLHSNKKAPSGAFLIYIFNSRQELFNQLEIERQRLEVEKSTLSSNTRIEKLATEQGMTVITPATTLHIKENLIN